MCQSSARPRERLKAGRELKTSDPAPGRSVGDALAEGWNSSLDRECWQSQGGKGAGNSTHAAVAGKMHDLFLSQLLVEEPINLLLRGKRQLAWAPAANSSSMEKAESQPRAATRPATQPRAATQGGRKSDLQPSSWLTSASRVPLPLPPGPQTTTGTGTDPAPQVSRAAP